MKKNINKLEQNLGYKISNFELYSKAITHNSISESLPMITFLIFSIMFVDFFVAKSKFFVVVKIFSRRFTSGF